MLTFSNLENWYLPILAWDTIRCWWFRNIYRYRYLQNVINGWRPNSMTNSLEVWFLRTIIHFYYLEKLLSLPLLKIGSCCLFNRLFFYIVICLCNLFLHDYLISKFDLHEHIIIYKVCSDDWQRESLIFIMQRNTENIIFFIFYLSQIYIRGIHFCVIDF